MNAFDERLWAYLKLQRESWGDERQAGREEPTPARRHRGYRRTLLTLATLGVVVVATVVALSSLGFGGKVAYAVTENSDGTLSIELSDILGVAGLNQRLAELGVRAKAYRMDPHCSASITELDWVRLYPEIVPQNGPSSGIMINPAAIPARTTLVLAAREGPPDATTAGSPSILVRLMLIAGGPPSCVGQVLSDPKLPPAGVAQHIEVPSN